MPVKFKNDISNRKKVVDNKPMLREITVMA
jgi:hypothetical protein